MNHYSIFTSNLCVYYSFSCSLYTLDWLDKVLSALISSSKISSLLPCLCQPLRDDAMYPVPEGMELGLVPLDVPRDVPPLRYEAIDLMRVKNNVMMGFVIGTVAAIISDVDSTTFQTSRGTVATTICKSVVGCRDWHKYSYK